MKNKKSLLTALLLSALMTSGFTLTGCSPQTSTDDTPTSITDDVGISVEEKGVKIKYLNSGTTDEGYAFKEFSFSVEPSGAADTNVYANVLYVDGTSCSSAVVVSVNNSDKIITLTCKQAFSKQIILTVTSELNSNVKATATIDYAKKLTNVTKCDKVHQYGHKVVSHSSGGELCTDCETIANYSYSIYSKDVDVVIDYDFYYADGITDVEIHGDAWPSSVKQDTQFMTTLLNEIYLTYIADENGRCNFNDMMLPSADEINGFVTDDDSEAQTLNEFINACTTLWALNNSGEQPDQGYLSADNYIDVTINQIQVSGSGKYFDIDNVKLRLYPHELDWSEFYTSPTNINLENSAFEF